MKFNHVIGYSLPEAYHRALLALHKNHLRVDCKDYNTTTKECGIVIEVKKPLLENRISKIFPGGPRDLQQYRMEISDGILDFMVGATENSWEYTYHQRIGDQLDFVVEELNRDKDSRRAIVLIRDNKVDQFTDHPACLQELQFLIREDKLDMVAAMRSNDALKASFMNMDAFIKLQSLVALKLGIPVGTYTHIANSYHVYEKDFKEFDIAILRIKKTPLNKLTYSYQDCYAALMEEAIPAIKETVLDQQSKYMVN